MRSLAIFAVLLTFFSIISSVIGAPTHKEHRSSQSIRRKILEWLRHRGHHGTNNHNTNIHNHNDIHVTVQVVGGSSLGQPGVATPGQPNSAAAGNPSMLDPTLQANAVTSPTTPELPASQPDAASQTTPATTDSPDPAAAAASPVAT
ncbi:hypothetical protein FRC17_004436 [Serendipita sp. 399]|nr:hypothetical protein FRC17_004436 [Serendipita sp. 399]